MLHLPTGEPGVKEESVYHFIAPQLDSTENLFFPGLVGHYYLDGTYCFSHNTLVEVKYPQGVTRIGNKIYFESKGQMAVEAKYTFLYVAEGTLAIISGSPPTTTVCSRSSCIVVDHDRAHTFYACSDAEMYFVLFGGNCSKELLDKILEFGNVAAIGRPFVFQNIMNRILNETGENRVLDDIEISSLMYSLIAEVYVSASKQLKKPASKMSYYLQYIQDHYKEPLTVESLARMANLNTAYFSEVFKQETGISPYEYLLQVSFSAAKDLLLYSSMSCAEIACEIGFCSSAHFIQSFKKRYGITPNKFRKDNRTVLMQLSEE